MPGEYELSVIRQLRAAKGSKEKLAILQALPAPGGVATITYLFIYTYNPFMTYGLRNFPPATELHETVPQDLPLYQVLDALSSRYYTGNDAIRLCQNLELTRPEEGELLRYILARDLDCGVQVSTINKAFPNLIPTFDVQLAAPREKVGLPNEGMVEEKFDGVRLLAFFSEEGVQLFSRNGQLHRIPLLEKQLQLLLPDAEGWVLDGEVIGENRQSVSGLMNKFRLGTGTDEESHQLHFHVFDCFTTHQFQQKHCPDPLETRRVNLTDFFLEWDERNDHYGVRLDVPNLHLVRQVSCSSSKEMEEHAARIMARGGEGVIVKPFGSKYQFKRTADWIKIKGILDCTLRVVETKPGEGKRSGGIGALRCVSADEQVSVWVGGGLSDAMLAQMNAESPVGKLVTVRYNMMVRPEGETLWSLFLPRFVRIESDRDEADHSDDIVRGF